MKSVSAGRLRRLMTFERMVTTQDSDGAVIEPWVPAFSDTLAGSRMPCEITPSSGNEFIAAAAAQSRVNARVKVRHREGFDAVTMRGTDEFGTVYNILAVLPDPDSGKRYLTLMCESGVGPGN